MFNFSLTFVWKSLTDSVKHDTKDHIDSADSAVPEVCRGKALKVRRSKILLTINTY